ncbi:MAG: choice-of-anchor J domain-containing protein [Muribaculaceae bacterium]|nr:choice-of-anchor J domain-containing protein [Muribaculaceae bacterium]
MRKFKTTMLALLAASTLPVCAQTLIDEGFEDVPGTEATTTLPAGWERQGDYAGSNINYRWGVHYSANGSTMSGHKYAMVDAPTYADPNNKDAWGPRQDVLLTPAVELDNTYQLAFDWEAAAYGVLSQGQYTFKVAIVDIAAGDTTVIFDITNEQQVRDSGVPADPYGTYMWANWAVQTSKIDLSPWQGKIIKVAFIYDLLKQSGNVLYLDNISIKQHKPETGPIAELSQTTYRFPDTYIGEKIYSEVMTLKNVGLKGLKVTGFEGPDAFGLVMDTVGMSLGVNETARFQICYRSTLTSPVEADLVLKTNGGDVTLHVTATKQAVPDGYQLELFEGDQFPPAGWQLSGSNIAQWGVTGYALEGDKSLYSPAYIEESQIVTPRLDLSNEETPATFMFTYYAQFIGEDYEYPSNDLLVQVATDGSDEFTTVWTADYTKQDTLINVSIDLSAYRSDDVRLRFVNTECYYDSEYGMDDGSNFFIDRVLLPGVYGVDGAPLAAELTAPADSAVNVYPKNVVLSWREAQFAEGYKVYVGKATAGNQQWDVINGLDVQGATTYTVPRLDYSTTYAWTVVPYNSVGENTETPVWVFTTQPDQSIADFPWSEGFESGTFAPLGWLAQGGKYTKWSASDYYPFDGKYSAMAYSNETEVEAVLTTPDVQLPADGAMQLSFWWGNERPVSLTKDNTQVRLNHSTADDGIDAVMMDIQVEGGEWQQLKLISDNSEGVDADGDPIRYWVYETVDLAPYAGKNVAFRWRYISHNYNRSRGAALDNVKIDLQGAQLSFSNDMWDAYKVNYGERETSPEMAVTNLGSEAVTIESVKFIDPSFTTTLKAGDVIGASESKLFTVTFNAGKLAAGQDSVRLDDAMVLTLSDGTQAEFDVTAVALASDIRFYGFEHDATGVGPEGFTVMDVDGQSTSRLTFWDFPNNGAPLSFFVLNDSQCYNSLKEPHGHQSLMTRCNNDGAFDDWIVSAPMTATEQSKFDFDMRNWESINSILPAGGPTLQVLVSTSSATDRSSFTQVGYDYTADLFDDVAWPHLSYDLSQYAGQRIYVALRAYSSDCLGAFYDNFEFLHFSTGLDVNGDGRVDIDDVNEIINVILDFKDNPRTDVNGDGKTDVDDLNLVINNILTQ